MATAAKKRTPEAMLDDLARDATPTKVKTQRPELPLMVFTGEDATTLLRFGEYKAIEKWVDKPAKELGEAVKVIAFDRWTELFFDLSTIPLNHRLTVLGDDGKLAIEATFEVRAKFSGLNKIVPAASKRDPNISAHDYIYMAIASGPNRITPRKANALIDEEIELTERLSLCGDLGEALLQPSDPDLRAAVEHIMAVLLAPAGRDGTVNVPAFTPEERALLTYKDQRPRFRSAATFLARILDYCNTLAQLRHVLTVFQVEMAITLDTFGGLVPGKSDEVTPRMATGIASVFGVGVKTTRVIKAK